MQKFKKKREVATKPTNSSRTNQYSGRKYQFQTLKKKQDPTGTRAPDHGMQRQLHTSRPSVMEPGSCHVRHRQNAALEY